MRKGKIFSKIFGIALIFVMIGAMLGGLLGMALPFGSFGYQSQALAQEAKTWYVDDDLADYPDADFTKIQEAVDAASSGDTIIVYPGTYTENVDVSKDHLTIRSENGADATIVQAASPDDHVFEVTADYVNISGFTVKGATGSSGGFGVSGIYLKGNISNTISDKVEHCHISENIVSNNRVGILLYFTYHNILTNNIVNSNSYYGILLSHGSAHDVLTDNIVNSNNIHGILLNCSQAILTGNAMSDNKYNLGVSGWGASSLGPWIRDYAHDMDTSNTVNGKPIYYLVDEHDRVIDSSTNAGYVGLVNCTSVTVKDLTLSNNGQGVLLIGSNDSRIENLNISNCDRGVSLLQSSANTLTRNTLSKNYEAIILTYSSNNILSDNTMSDNRYNFDLCGSELSHFIQGIDTSNTINGKPIYYWVDEENKKVPSDASFVGVVNCNNIIIEDLTLESNGKGMLLAYSANSRIENVNVSNNWNYGIYLYSSANNTLSNNTLSNNEYGICIDHSPNNTLNNNIFSNRHYEIIVYYSSNNTFYLNNFFHNICSHESTNTWNSPEEITYTYSGNTYANYLGNYWSDYTGSDANGDGIGDTPYSTNSDKDSYPLMRPFESYEIGPEPKTWYVDDDLQDYPDADFTKIQDAVKVASPGDTVKVSSGTYYETIDVNKALTLYGIDTGDGKPVVDAGGGGAAITLSADGVTLEGFEATNSDSGIRITSNDNTIEGNTAGNNEFGGIVLSSSNGNIIRDNVASNNHYYGIYLGSSSNNSITGNSTTGNYWGINLDHSGSNTLRDNLMSDIYNFTAWGSSDSHFDNDVDTTNLVDGKPIYYLVDVSAAIIDSSSNAGTVYCINYDNVTVRDLTLTNNNRGIYFRNTTNSTIEGNHVSNNYLEGIRLDHCDNNTIIGNTATKTNSGNGIHLSYSSSNTITGNTASNNEACGVYLLSSDKNKLYLNNFVNNSHNALSLWSTNIWNSSEPITYRYKDSTFTNYLGNHWGDYEDRYPQANETDSTGIWDTPYDIDSDEDNYPLVEPFENYEAGRKGDFDGDGDIDFDDFVCFSAAYRSELEDDNYNPIGDFNDDGHIDFDDFVDFAAVYGT